MALLLLPAMILAGAAVLVQLGALSVWVLVLRFGLIAAVVAVVALTIALVWRRLASKLG